jgi:putative chitinase
MADAGDFERITRKINGGLNGEDGRVALWEAAKAVLS